MYKIINLSILSKILDSSQALFNIGFRSKADIPLNIGLTFAGDEIFEFTLETWEGDDDSFLNKIGKSDLKGDVFIAGDAIGLFSRVGVLGI